MAANLITPPTVEPVTLDEAKAHLRLTHTLHDTMIEQRIIPAMRERMERRIGRAMCRQTWEMSVDAHDGAIELYPLPVLAIVSVTYVAPDGTTQTLAQSDYALDNKQRRAWLLPAYGVTWPAIASVANAITVTYRCGYSDSTDAAVQRAAVPPSLKHALLLDIAAAYEAPTGYITGTIVTPLPNRHSEGLVDGHRIWRV